MALSPPLAVTMGEPAGVGGEITAKAWAKRNEAGLTPFFVIGDADWLKASANFAGVTAPIEVISDPAQATDVFASALPVLEERLSVPAQPGELNGQNGAHVIRSIERAVELTKSGQASAVVTNPIHKAALYDCGFKHPGHTEFLAHLSGEVTPVMMLACSKLRVVLATVHVSIRDVVDTLSQDKITSVAKITAAALKRDFGIDTPRIAVAGLNPHAGESGAMGTEEQTIITPAIEALKAQGIDAFGPLPPDTMFAERMLPTYDAALCMYHDQGLIPLKTLDFDGGVNITLGLDFVRTSPDHGTALNLAGTGGANERSLIEALKTAAAMAKARRGQP